jgi:peptidoglycan/LPS O-acetylase OafA/YrhL
MDRLIRLTTALAVLMVASVAAVISYAHELVTSHGETGVTARLLPFTVDGLIWAASMVALDASRRNHPVPRLALWSLSAGIVATVGANLAHGLDHGLDHGPSLAPPAPPVVQLAPTLNQTVRDLHAAGHSQRSIARDLNLGRRKVKQIIDREVA